MSWKFFLYIACSSFAIETELTCLMSLKVNKAQNAQKGLEYSRTKDAKGTPHMGFEYDLRIFSSNKICQGLKLLHIGCTNLDVVLYACATAYEFIDCLA